MRRFLISFFSVLSALVVMAQSQFSSLMLKGDMMMRQQMYDMALDYYSKALASAASSDETAQAQRKIKSCKDVVAAIEAKHKAEESKPSSKLLFKDDYLETGDVMDPESGEVFEGDDDHGLSLFSMEVYSSCIRIVNHIDMETKELILDIPSGAVYKLLNEDKEVREFVSEDGKERFLISKEIDSNKFGRYREAVHIVNDVCYVLYASAEVKLLLSEEEAARETSPSETNQVEEEVFPLSFENSWALNLDADGIRLGDTRSEPIQASKVCWLMVRSRYDCPDTLEEEFVFDVRVYDPSGTLAQFSDKNIKAGFSTTVSLSTVPGGGIMNFAFGQDTPGSFEKGRYRVEFWYGGKLCHAVNIVLQ